MQSNDKDIETPFRFLDLAPELRNRIYDFAVPQGKKYISRRVSINGARPPPAICRTCVQLREETLPIWRSMNVFVFRYSKEVYDPTEQTAWLRELAKNGLEHINCLNFRQRFEYLYEWPVQGMTISWVAIIICKRAYSMTFDATIYSHEIVMEEMRRRALLRLERDLVMLYGELTGRNVENARSEGEYDGLKELFEGLSTVFEEA